MFDLFGGLLGGLGSGLGGLFGGTGGLLSGGLAPLSGTPANVPLPPMRPPELGASFVSPGEGSLFGNLGKMNDDQKKMLQYGNAMMAQRPQQERARLGAWQASPVAVQPIQPFSTFPRR
jgi:hypothetical protein